MRVIFRFIHSNQFILLFLLLQVLAVSLTARHHLYHQAFFFHSANHLTGNVYLSYSRLASYFSLKEENQQLKKENTRLRNKLSGNYIITDRQVFELEDHLYRRRYVYVHANVINQSVNRRNNYITLDKGRLDGIKPNMGVIAPGGVAGIVKHVSDNFSVVMSLLHSDAMISVRILKNDHIGSLIWEGGDYQTASLTYIPPHVEMAVGDTIVTSGYSSVIPAGVFIGTVQDWEIRRGEVFYTASVHLQSDMNRLTYVYVVKDLLGEEKESLESIPVL